MTEVSDPSSMYPSHVFLRHPIFSTTGTWVSCAGCGTQSNLQYSATFNTSPVPLPAVGLLMLSGLAGLGAMVRKRPTT